MAISSTVRLGFDGADVQRGFAGLKKSLSGIGSGIAKMGTGIAAIGAGAVAGLTAFVVTSSNAASSIESLTSQFKTLLGSQEAASKRMEEIAKFAAETPYEISELSQTSKLLQTMGGTLLATGEGLRMVGDAAATAGQPLSEIGLHIGRIFNAITSGTSAGESVGRLQELGLITGDVKREFEMLAEKQKKGVAASLTAGQALVKLKSVMSQTTGAMKDLAATTEGKISNMKDNISQLQVAFGTGMNNGLRVALDAINAFIPQFIERFTVIGSHFGQAIGDAVAGDTSKFEKIGDYIGTAMGVATETAYQMAAPSLMRGISRVMEDINPIRRGAESLGMDFKRGSQYGDQSFSELLKSNAINAGLEAKGQIITGQTPQAYQPTMHSPAFKNAQQEAMLEELKKQNALLLRMSQTSKM